MTDTTAKPQPTPKAEVAPVVPAKPVATKEAVKEVAPPAVAKAPVKEAPAPVVAKAAVKEAAAPIAAKVSVKEIAPPVVSAATPIKKQTPAAPRPVVKPVAKKPAPRATPIAAPKRPAAPPATYAVKELKMVETIKTVTDKTQAYFAEATERTKGAVEKGVKAFEEANTFHKGNIEAIVESSKIAAKGAEKLGQDAAAYAKSSYEKANEAFKAMSAVKSPTDLFKLQSDFVRTSFDAFVAETSRSTEAALKLAGEIAQPLSNRFALAAEKVKAAA